MDAERGFTFKPESFSNEKYFDKIIPNFLQRNKNFIEEKQKFINDYSASKEQAQKQQKVGYGKYTKKEKEEITSNIIQRLYKQGLEKYSQKNISNYEGNYETSSSNQGINQIIQKGKNSQIPKPQKHNQNYSTEEDRFQRGEIRSKEDYENSKRKQQKQNEYENNNNLTNDVNEGTSVNNNNENNLLISEETPMEEASLPKPQQMNINVTNPNDNLYFSITQIPLQANLQNMTNEMKESLGKDEQ